MSVKGFSQETMKIAYDWAIFSRIRGKSVKLAK